MSNINAHFKNMATTCDAVKRRCGNLKQGKKQFVPTLVGDENSGASKDLNKQAKKDASKDKHTKQK